MGTEWTCFDNSSGYVYYHVTQGMCITMLLRVCVLPCYSGYVYYHVTQGMCITMLLRVRVLPYYSGYVYYHITQGTCITILLRVRVLPYYSGYVYYHITGEYFSFASSTGFKLFAELYTDIQYNVHLHIMHFSPYMYIHGRAFCLECAWSVVGSNPTRGSHLSLKK